MSNIHASPLLYPVLAHIAWITLLYAVLTIVRAPDAWKLGTKADGSNPFSKYEPRISANLRNQFEWPILFYTISVLLILDAHAAFTQQLLAWLFVVGRILHSLVQILLDNIRLRGVVFTINFVAVLCMWVVFVVDIQ